MLAVEHALYDQTLYSIPQAAAFCDALVGRTGQPAPGMPLTELVFFEQGRGVNRESGHK